MTRRQRWVKWAALAAAALYGILSFPEPAAVAPQATGYRPFVWARDALWDELERRFARARVQGCGAIEEPLSPAVVLLDAALSDLESRTAKFDDPAWTLLEQALFEAGVATAACPQTLPSLASRLIRFRRVVKHQSTRWPLGNRQVRERIYRLLYGARTTFEEVLSQREDISDWVLQRGEDEPSQCPAFEFRGVRLHSGDVLLSRGGAPTSALIARGNDFPGNFSHVALLHVAESGSASVIEAHIERGVAIASPEEYLADKKLRILVLRPRAALPELAKNPLLPHRAATAAYEAVASGHIPYDFAMDVKDSTRLFCSEVASAAYAKFGLRLWRDLSSISSPGTMVWLSSLGVREFRTFAPSDLEYDPSMSVVAEWRSPEALAQDRRDNAILDALLAGADRGEVLHVSRFALPLVRLAKAYSVALNLVGRVGPIPEGMSASVALRVRDLTERHRRIAATLEQEEIEFAKARGFDAPYWELVRMAERAKEHSMGTLRSAP